MSSTRLQIPAAGALLFLLSSCSDPNAPGKLRPDAVVIYQGREIDAETLARCGLYGECSGTTPISIIDVAHEGNDVYLLARPGGITPSLFVSHDVGATWVEHPLPPSYDTVEGVQDGDPGSYLLHVWKGHIYLLVGAITVQAQYHYHVPAEVDLVTNTYRLSSTHLDRISRVSQGQVLTGSTQGNGTGAVHWGRYDFTTDVFTVGGEIPITPTANPSDGWTSVDGQKLTTTSSVESAPGVVKLCHHTIDTSTGGKSYTTLCMPRLRVPITSGSEGNPSTFPVAHAGEAWQLTQYRQHALMVGFVERNNQAQVVSTIDLGLGKPDPNGLLSARYAGFFHIAALNGSSATEDASRLVRVNDNGSVDEVGGVPRTPCQSGGVCGYSIASGGGYYGATQWLEPLDNGEVLAFSSINQASQGTHEVLVVTHERPTFSPVQTTPIDFGVWAEYPDAKPPSELDKQCLRAIVCGAHKNLAECQNYWATVRHGLGGADKLYAKFLAVPAGSCDYQPAYADRLLTMPNSPPPPCAPGCSGEWATYSCAPWGNLNMIPRQNCTALGGTCQLDSMGRGYCGTRAMSAGECDKCAGQVAIACADIAMPSVIDCAALGGQCHTQSGHAFCSSGVCAANNRIQCSGEVQEVCGLAPEFAFTDERDCGRISSSCADSKGSCVVQPDDCGIVKTVSNRSGQVCDDGVLGYCDGTGAAHVVDCRSLGFHSCAYVPSTPTQTWANCVP